MKNVVIMAVIERLNNSIPDTNKTISVSKNDIQLATDINFFELYNLYLELKLEGYELTEMTKDSIKVLKTKDTIYFNTENS
jgi:hypothetical protein